jgi:hypothetical protein
MLPTGSVPRPVTSPHVNSATNTTSMMVSRTMAIVAAVLSLAGSYRWMSP